MAVKDIAVLFIIVFVSKNVLADDPPCFVFKGDSFLTFSLPERFSNRNNVHYELQFRTTSLNGVLMYARGPQHDYEALYIRGGNLHYHLFNTAPGGLGDQFGGHFVSEKMVNNNSWITVHIYRSWFEAGRGSRGRSRTKTGIEFMLNGRLRSYVDYREREGIEITNTIYFGGYSSSLSRTVGNYTGEMRGITEHKSNHRFEHPSLNFGSGVEFHCKD